MAVTLHTNLGDVKLEVYCDTAPRTSFNFLALCATEYYNGTKFHRNMRGFVGRDDPRRGAATNHHTIEEGHRRREEGGRPPLPRLVHTPCERERE